MNEKYKEYTSKDFDRIFDEAVEEAFRTRPDPSDRKSPSFSPEIADGLRAIFDQPRFKYRRYEEDDLSWLEQAEKLRKRRAAVDDR
jgi:hypothetical protein